MVSVREGEESVVKGGFEGEILWSKVNGSTDRLMCGK